MINAEVITKLSDKSKIYSDDDNLKELSNFIKIYYKNQLLNYNPNFENQYSFDTLITPNFVLPIKQTMAALRYANDILTPLPKENSTQGIIFDTISQNVKTAPRLDPIFDRIIGTIDFGNNDSFLTLCGNGKNVGCNVE